jgi:hypothetical protein
MFNLLEVETRHFARLQGHDVSLSISLFLRQRAETRKSASRQGKEKAGDGGGGVTSMPASNNPIAREEFANGLFRF